MVQALSHARGSQPRCAPTATPGVPTTFGSTTHRVNNPTSRPNGLMSSRDQRLKARAGATDRAQVNPIRPIQAVALSNIAHVSPTSLGQGIDGAASWWPDRHRGLYPPGSGVTVPRHPGDGTFDHVIMVQPIYTLQPPTYLRPRHPHHGTMVGDDGGDNPDRHGAGAR